MKKYTNCSIAFLLVLFLFPIAGFSQFRYKSEMLEVDKSGYYHILLGSDVLSLAHGNLQDIRIFDKNENEVPYLLKKTEEKDYAKIPFTAFTQKDSSNKNTYLYFTKLDKPCYADRLGFEIYYPPGYYQRAGCFTVQRETDNCAIEKQFVLSSKNKNVIETAWLLDSNTVIKIKNEDNPSLTIRHLTIFQQRHYLTAYLDEEKTYFLFWGDNNLPMAKYDLVNFENEIPQRLPVVGINRVTILDVPQKVEFVITPPEKTSHFFERPVFLWLIIGVVGGLLILMCFQIIRKTEIHNSKM